MKKQTAIQWLVEQVNSDCLNSIFIRQELVDQAKAMEMEQMVDFADNCQEMFLHQIVEKYNETYGGEK